MATGDLTAEFKIDRNDETGTLLTAIRAHSESSTAEESVAYDLARLLTSRPKAELAEIRDWLAATTFDGTHPR